jgi:polysaccharide export outer membrane protein
MKRRFTRLAYEVATLMLLASPVAALQSTGSPAQTSTPSKENLLAAKPEAPSPKRDSPEGAKPVPAVAPEKTADSPSAASNPSGYRIGEQDLLNITVWKEPELSGSVVVRPDGKITLPLVNDIHAAGLSPDELRELITERLHPFLTVPEVTVAVREINSRKVYVIGQIAHEGSYRINSTTTVLQIIAEAGGLNEFANRKRIYLLRKENGAQIRLNFNYDKVVKGKDPSQDVLLRPGDTIVVP